MNDGIAALLIECHHKYGKDFVIRVGRKLVETMSWERFTEIANAFDRLRKSEQRSEIFNRAIQRLSGLQQ